MAAMTSHENDHHMKTIYTKLTIFEFTILKYFSKIRGIKPKIDKLTNFNPALSIAGVKKVMASI